ncbi:microfibril-associated glycoprotein 4 [Aedes albopictus]|uniref:Putative ficolin-like protein n=1 Tax=Aedes albopictus TaxID=7160 RepID=A0A023ERT9_AEDAL
MSEIISARLSIFFLVFIIWNGRFVKSLEPSTEQSIEPVASSNFGYEVLLTKMDYLEYKLMELEFEIKEQNEQTTRNQARLEKTHEGMSWMMTRMEEAISQNFTSIMGQSWKILQRQISCAHHESLRNEMFKMKPVKGPSDNVRMLFDLQQFKARGPFESCKAEPTKTSGKYMLQPFPTEDPFVAFCEQTKFGGGWLVIQHRYDGSMEFYRNWTEYKNGFGEADKEFWIGLERLHKLTETNHQLLIELEDFTGDYKYARYAGFQIGNETEKYSLKTLGAYSGTAGDSLTYHKGMMFTTLDSDNDKNAANCAETSSGAWWYNTCHHSNLNGKFMTGNDQRAMSWYHFKSSHYGLKYTRMMIREM